MEGLKNISKKSLNFNKYQKDWIILIYFGYKYYQYYKKKSTGETLRRKQIKTL